MTESLKSHQECFDSHTFDRIEILLVLVFPRYKKFCCAPLGAVNFLYNLKILESIEFLFEREFIYAWNRKRFSMIWFLFSSLKSEIKRTVLSFFGIKHLGAPHWEWLTFFMTLRYSSRSSSYFNVISFIRGTVKCFQ